MAKTLQVAEVVFAAVDKYARRNVQDQRWLRMRLRDHRENILPHRKWPRPTIDRAPIPNTARPSISPPQCGGRLSPSLSIPEASNFAPCKLSRALGQRIRL